MYVAVYWVFLADVHEQHVILLNQLLAVCFENFWSAVFPRFTGGNTRRESKWGVHVCKMLATHTHTHRMHSRVLFHQNKKSEVEVLASAHFIGGGGVLVYYNAKLFLTTTATDIQLLLCRGSGLVKWLLSAEMNGVT
jgi:hypothetical protein